MAHSACLWNAGCARKTVIPWQCVLYLSASLEIFRMEALYKSTTFTCLPLLLMRRPSRLLRVGTSHWQQPKPGISRRIIK